MTLRLAHPADLPALGDIERRLCRFAYAQLADAFAFFVGQLRNIFEWQQPVAGAGDALYRLATFLD